MHPKSWIPRRLEGERSWNGFAILARKREPVLIRDMLPGDSGDKQSRYIEAAVDGVAIASIYLPNGNPQPGPKFKYKIVWFDRLRRLQRRAHRLRHLRDAIVQGQCAVAAGAPRGLCEAVGGRLDRRAAVASSGRSDVHPLELSQKPLAPGC
jgi:exonuclease III